MNASTITAAMAMNRRRLDLGSALTATPTPSGARAQPTLGPTVPGGGSMPPEISEGLAEGSHRHELQRSRHRAGVPVVVLRHEEQRGPGGFRGRDLVPDPADRPDPSVEVDLAR